MTLHRTTVTKRLFALLASTSLIMTMGAAHPPMKRNRMKRTPPAPPLPPMPATW